MRCWVNARRSPGDGVCTLPRIHRGYGAAAAFLWRGWLANLLGNSPHKNRLLLACIFLFGISLFFLAWSHWFWLTWAILFLVGMGSIVPMGTTVLQLSVPAEFQGRVMSVWYISAAFMFIGSYPMTLVGEYVSWTAAFSGGAAIYLTVAFVLGVWRPTLRRLRV